MHRELLALRGMIVWFGRNVGKRERERNDCNWKELSD
jgi:hypothetical protein